MSMHRLSAGAGYEYLLRHTASGDVHRPVGTSLTAYYADSGYPPGRWLGTGLRELALAPTEVVTEPQMSNLYGHGQHPVTGTVLGKRYRRYASLTERVDAKAKRLPTKMSPADRAEQVAGIEQAESERTMPKAVAGFDLTFTVPKSVSVLWGLADPTTQEVIAQAHRTATEAALAFLEDRALFTRTGTDGCAQVRTRGMVAAAFDHWDTRTGDPNLHTHVVVANKVQGPDGVWRALDSRALHHAAVAVSELYDNLVADTLTTTLPISWGWRDRGERRTPAFEVEGISDELLSMFSTRAGQVDQVMRDLISAFEAEHARGPNRVEVLRLRQRATRASRPGKTLVPLPELMARWRTQASGLTGSTAEQIAEQVLSVGNRTPSVGNLDEETLSLLAGRTLEAVMDRRSTWTPWNVLTEAQRATRGLRAATPADRIALVDAVTDKVLQRCLLLDAPDPVPLPADYLNRDGHSVFTRPGERRYSHPRLLDAEQSLLEANTRLDASAVPDITARRVARHAYLEGQYRPVPLAADQYDAVVAIATSSRSLEVLVGPAGAGKTTTLAALRSAWETAHGIGSVIGLAPSATAAQELSYALTIPCENTTKWLYETTGRGGQRRRQALAELHAKEPSSRAEAKRKGDDLHHTQQLDHHWRLHPTQLLIVDEASLAGTLALDQLRAQAEAVGAKVLLVGDHQQLTGLEASGAFGLLTDRGHAHELQTLWRFQHEWEADATRQLRAGDPAVLDAYLDHDRLTGGPAELMLEGAYQAWQRSEREGQTALLLASDSRTTDDLNARAHHDRLAAGLIAPAGVRISGRDEAAVGDRIVTRRNDRALSYGPDTDRQHVRNGALWTVTATHRDGSLTATPLTHRASNSVRLPAAYVRAHVELGYACTIHRAQGMTVDTCHTVVTEAMTRESFYVAMTRGRASNHAYVTTESDSGSDLRSPDEARTVRAVLEGVLDHTGAERSATQTIEDRQREATSLSALLPIRNTLRGDADREQFTPLIHASPLSPDDVQAVLQSPARGALFAALRHCHTRGLDPAHALTEVLHVRDLDGTHNLAAVLHERLDTLLAHQPGSADGVQPLSAPSQPLRTALAEYDELVDQRLAQLANQSEPQRDSAEEAEQAWRRMHELADEGMHLER